MEATFVVALDESIAKRGREFLDLHKRLGIRSMFLFVQDSLCTPLNSRVE